MSIALILCISCVLIFMLFAHEHSYLFIIHYRLQPVRLRDNSNGKLICEFKGRMFFKICLEDTDFVTEGFESPHVYQPLNMKPEHLMVGYIIHLMFFMLYCLYLLRNLIMSHHTAYIYV